MPPRRRGPTKDRHFRAGPELYEAAQAKAAREGRDMSKILRHALWLYLHDELPWDIPGDQETGSDNAG
jgi:hypothetical protein